MAACCFSSNTILFFQFLRKSKLTVWSDIMVKYIIIIVKNKYPLSESNTYTYYTFKLLNNFFTFVNVDDSSFSQ